MGFYGMREVGYLGKASTIAIKFDIVYSPSKQKFIGEQDAVQKATEQFDLWRNARARRVRQETR